MDKLRLIAEVYRRPGLWDVNSEEYNCLVPELWKEVATRMGPNVTIEECKRKWKNLRDAYGMQLKRMEARIKKNILKGTYDPKNDYTGKWPYFEHLKFIKDMRRPRRHCTKYLNTPCTGNYDEDDNDDLEETSEFSDIYKIKEEPDLEINADTYEDDDTNDNKIPSEQFSNEIETQQSHVGSSSKSSPAILIKKEFSTEDFTENNLTSSCCKGPKRSYQQMHIQEELERQEQRLIKSARLGIPSNDMVYVGDSDYNFLVSFLPQLRKMNEWQNLQFRRKMTKLALTIMYKSTTNKNVTSTSSLEDRSENITNSS